MSTSLQEEPAARPVRLALLLIGTGDWRGGINYQRTLLQTIAGPLAHRIEAQLFVTPAQRELAQEAFGPWLKTPMVVDDRIDRAGIGRRAVTALIRGKDKQLAALLAAHDIDVVFETARFLGWSFPIPSLVWMPDFQHRYLPHLFTRQAWWKRELGYRAQSRGKRLVMLSSATARDDSHRFYPILRGRTRVVRFSPSVDPIAVHNNVEAAQIDHDLPPRFFYMPNQFWAHKNHRLVLEALILIRDHAKLNELPPIVMSGPTSDYRSSGLFKQIMDIAGQEGLLPWFRHLGLIPMADVLALNAGALAVLNPSLFEGWASSVEEAKAVGSPLILSDIPVHREQAPWAQFFNPTDPSELAEALITTANSPLKRQNDFAALIAANRARNREFAEALNSAVYAAHAL